MKTSPIILPSIPGGGLQAAETHAVVRGKSEFQIVQVNSNWTVALERWEGNLRQTPWRAHLFDSTGKWRGVTVQARATSEQAYKDSLGVIAAKK
jgi:hypothetical protein